MSEPYRPAERRDGRAGRRINGDLRAGSFDLPGGGAPKDVHPRFRGARRLRLMILDAGRAIVVLVGLAAAVALDCSHSIPAASTDGLAQGWTRRGRAAGPVAKFLLGSGRAAGGHARSTAAKSPSFLWAVIALGLAGAGVFWVKLTYPRAPGTGSGSIPGTIAEHSDHLP